MRTLLTDGGGFIGNHFRKAMKGDGFESITFDNLSTGNRSAVRFCLFNRGTSRGPSRERGVRPPQTGRIILSAVSALVGKAMINPTLYNRSNFVGIVNLCKACVQTPIRAFVFSSFPL